MAEIIKKKRIFQIAREFNIPHDDIISFLHKLGMENISVNSPIEIDVYNKIYTRFSKDDPNSIPPKDIKEIVEPSQYNNNPINNDKSDANSNVVSLHDKLLKEKKLFHEEKNKTNTTKIRNKWIKLGSNKANEILKKYLKSNIPRIKGKIEKTNTVLINNMHRDLDDTVNPEHEEVLKLLHKKLDVSIKKNTHLSNTYNNEFNTNYKYKKNWVSFREIIAMKNISILYHFTDKKNIRSIIDNGGLYSWYSCFQNNIKIPAQGGGTLSMALDTKYHLQDYVHISFNNNQPMCYVAKKEGRIHDVIYLKISPEVIFFKDTLFSDENATANSASIGGSIDDFKKIDITRAKLGNWQNDHEKKLVQAEVLVRSHIPIRFIQNI